MKKISYLFIACYVILNSLNAQNIGINGNGNNAHASALLDIDAVATPSLGILIPRIALQAVNLASPVTAPATSLLVYNTVSASSGTNAVVPGYYYWNGARWLRLANGLTATDSQSLSITGNTIAISNGNSITLPPSTDNQTLSLTGSTLSISNGNTVNLIGTGGFTHYIGEVFGGGVIAHLWKDNFGAEHGIITSTVDISTSADWGGSCNTTLVPGGATSSWNGAANTAAIVASCGLGTAAQLCDAYAGGGFTDWYLPAITEWEQINNNLTEINRSLQNIGGTLIENIPGLSPQQYWTSTEFDNDQAYQILLYSGASAFPGKFFNYYVRAVRAF